MNRMECSICHGNIKSSQNKKLSCGHSFHMKCIYSWLPVAPTCPICRQVVQTTPGYDAPYNEYQHWVNCFVSYLKSDMYNSNGIISR